MGKGSSFWSTVPGLLTGLAGVLTAVVTLVTLAVSQGWVGSGGTGDGEPSSSGSGTAAPVLEVDPETLPLSALPFQDPSGEVTVHNRGTEPFTVGAPELTGDDAEAFDVRSECPPELASGRSCVLTVTFDENGPNRARATLVISVNDGQRSAEVALEGTSVV